MRDFIKIKQIIQNGGVIAYPTEGVYGLGCDPLQEKAVEKILALKARPKEKGLILVASDFYQLQDFLAPLSQEVFKRIQSSWPGPITWICPISSHAPAWIKGAHESIAVRVSAHPIVQALCQGCGHALVSTSANLSSEAAATTQEEVEAQFKNQLDYIVAGEIGSLGQATPIYDALTLTAIRT
jgi:L-threonylcarbamoyladenylate synthase